MNNNKPNNTNENDVNLVKYIMSDQYKIDMAEAWTNEQMKLLRKEIKDI